MNDASYQHLANQERIHQEQSQDRPHHQQQPTSSDTPPPDMYDPYVKGAPEEYLPPPVDQGDNLNHPALRPSYAEYAQDLNQLKPKEASCHCQACFATFLLILGIGLALLFYFQEEISEGVMAGIIAGSYVLYLMVACCCNTLGKYLSNIEKGEEFEPYTEKVRAMIGRFEFHAECYHYQTRHHTRTVTDSNGNSRTEHYTTTEKVVTHRATEHLTPTRTIDESGRADRIRANASIVFIHFLIAYRFDSLVSSRNFEMRWDNFKRRNTFDSHQDFRMKYEVPGLVERKAYYVGELTCSYELWYFLCGMVGMLWPYSLWVESHIERFTITHTKVLTV